jgi:hypothetical protein
MIDATTRYAADKARILELVENMFDAISWAPNKAPDFALFRAPVRDDAVLVPASRPPSPTSIADFVGRMTDLYAANGMALFDERPSTTVVHVVGNLAVAIGSFVANADGSESRGANGFLFVRNADDWEIAAMAWDNESDTSPMPEDLQ